MPFFVLDEDVVIDKTSYFQSCLIFHVI